MAKQEGRILGFGLLDDLMLVPPRELRPALAALGLLDTAHIGPAMEYALQERAARGCLPALQSIASGLLVGDLLRTLSGPRYSPTSNTSTSALRHEFSRLATESRTDMLLARAFKHRLADAAFRAGFDKVIAKGLAAAFGELEDNARRHSERPDTVLLAYRWCPGEFEMVVADAGIGVRDSLHTHPDYSGISDHGAALTVALCSGETRFGRGSGHGTGFDTVFRNMAGMLGALRFRSGDHSLELQGLSPSLVNSKLAQRSYFQGFVASIICGV